MEWYKSEFAVWAELTWETRLFVKENLIMNNDLQVYPISGVDPSLVGCTIGGWEVKRACTKSDGDSPISENL